MTSMCVTGSSDHSVGCHSARAGGPGWQVSSLPLCWPCCMQPCLTTVPSCRYTEDCSISKPHKPEDTGLLDPGYAEHAYDTAAAQKLWDTSLPWVGLPASA